MGVPPNGWFIRENPIKMVDLGVPLFQETSILLRLGRAQQVSVSSPQDDEFLLRESEFDEFVGKK